MHTLLDTIFLSLKAGVGEEASGGSGGRGGSPESRGSAAAGAGSRPGSARRIHRHSSSGNVMLDQLLKDLGNRLTVAEDVCLPFNYVSMYQSSQ